jgi:hypothetical protein
MSNTEDFSPREWALLADAPLAAATAVALASPGGGEEEADMILRGWREVGALFPESPLVQRLVRDFDPSQGGGDAGELPGYEDPEQAYEALVEHALTRCAAAAQLLAERADPLELDDYRKFVLNLAYRVARSAGEGGLFGMGQATVSAEEREVLDALAKALRG